MISAALPGPTICEAGYNSPEDADLWRFPAENASPRFSFLPKTAAMELRILSDTVWLLMVFKPSRSQADILRHLGLRRARKDHGNWWRTFDLNNPFQEKAAEEVRVALRDAGINGNWKEVPRQPIRYLKTAKGKGATRNNAAAPNGRATPEQKIAVLQIETAKEVRLAADALKRATEKRRQAEKAAAAATKRRAQTVIRLARGES